MVESQINLFTGELEVCTVSKDSIRSGLEGMKDFLLSKYVKKVGAVIKKLEEIGLPKHGEQYRLVTLRSFNAVEFIQYITIHEIIVTLNLAIYSINYQASKILIQLADQNKINEVNIMMSNLRNKAHREKETIIKNQFSKHQKFNLFFCQSHAKMMACKTSKENYYNIEGSGNLAYNSRVEQYVIDNDKAIYDFSCMWMNQIKEYLDGHKELEIC